VAWLLPHFEEQKAHQTNNNRNNQRRKECISGYFAPIVMTKIGLISDTHGFLDEAVFTHFKVCDEIWHAGDFGPGIAEKLQAFKPLKGVFGNIDDAAVRQQFPETLQWHCEKIGVLMTHIGGYPSRYAPQVRQALTANPTQLFISGHSHILKVMYDAKFACLHMNPGAAGNHGWHQMRTLIRFVIDGAEIKDCEVIELGKRGGIKPPAHKAST
jgi:putative phosphoesterase